MVDDAQTKEHSDKNSNDDANNHQNRRNYSADFAGLGRTTARGIHRAGVYFLQIAGAHHPGRNAQRTADDQTKNAKDQNKCAAMWFHN